MTELTRFDAYEVSPVHEWNDEGTIQCEAHLTEAEAIAAAASGGRVIWSLYGHQPEGGVECIGDFNTEAAALAILYRITGIMGKPGQTTHPLHPHDQSGIYKGLPDGGRTPENETLFDLAVFLGADLGEDRIQRTGQFADSRDHQDILTEWANEFNAAHTGRAWDGEYLDEIEVFYEIKVSEFRRPPFIPSDPPAVEQGGPIPGRTDGAICAVIITAEDICSCVNDTEQDGTQTYGITLAQAAEFLRLHGSKVTESFLYGDWASSINDLPSLQKFMDTHAHDLSEIPLDDEQLPAAQQSASASMAAVATALRARDYDSATSYGNHHIEVFDCDRQWLIDRNPDEDGLYWRIMPAKGGEAEELECEASEIDADIIAECIHAKLETIVTGGMVFTCDTCQKPCNERGRCQNGDCDNCGLPSNE